jgi:dolichol-phosphate mannosyltransferase
MDGKRLLVSIIVPVFDEEECVSVVHLALCRVCDPLPCEFEFLFVDDGSTDATPASLYALRDADPRVRYLILSRNFGQQAALAAGLEHATGDVVITMDGDLEHPPALIPRMIERFREGFDVVATRRRAKVGAGWLKHKLAAAFVTLFNRLAALRIEPAGTEYRLLSRRVADVLIRLPERRRFLPGMIAWLGFPQVTIDFDAERRYGGDSKHGLAHHLRKTLDGIAAFSVYPFRKIAFFGACLATLAAIYAIAADLSSLWASMSFLVGVQFLLTGVIGAYVGRALDQVGGRPRYLVKEQGGDEPRPRKRRRRRRDKMTSRPPTASNLSE